MRQGFSQPLLLGVASHHAGCLPAWKGLVERLFQRGEALTKRSGSSGEVGLLKRLFQRGKRVVPLLYVASQMCCAGWCDDSGTHHACMLAHFASHCDPHHRPAQAGVCHRDAGSRHQYAGAHHADCGAVAAARRRHRLTPAQRASAGKGQRGLASSSSIRCCLHPFTGIFAGRRVRSDTSADCPAAPHVLDCRWRGARGGAATTLSATVSSFRCGGLDDLVPAFGACLPRWWQPGLLRHPPAGAEMVCG